MWRWSARLERWVWTVWLRVKSKGREADGLEELGGSKVVVFMVKVAYVR
jgi:hypothetical protein